MNRTILSLAILKTHWEKNKHDYIDNFIPMMANLLNEKKYSEIKIEDFKKDFLEKYGLDIPLNPLVTIFNRATKRKIIYREHGKFFINHDKITDFDLEIKSTEIERKFKHVTNSIKSFAIENYDIDPNEKDIEEALLSFLKQHDLDILFAAKDKSVLPEAKSSKKLRYLISAFAIYAQESEPAIFQILLDISIGHALSGAILYSEINSFSGKLKNLNIYVDTPIILSLIGYDGKFKQKAVIELLQILHEEKANLFILDITRGEIDSILYDCQRWLERGNYRFEKSSKTLKFCHRNGINSSDVQSKILKLDEILKSYNIYPSKVPDHVENKKFQIDINSLKDTIIDTYKSINKNFNPEEENKNETIDRDVKVLSGIYRFRKGYKPKIIKDCTDLFITSNTALAFASRVFETKDNGTTFTIPTCLTDVFLGTVIWLQTPQKIESLNEKRFIANCYSSVQPSDLLIKRYMAEVEKMKSENKITSDEYYLLRSHRASINLLEAKTMSDPEAFNGETADEILDNLKSQLKSEEAEKLTKEKNEHTSTKEKLQKKDNEINFINSNLDYKAQNIALLIGKSVFYILLFITAIVLIISLSPESFNLSNTLKIFTWVVFGILSLLNIVTGFNIKGLKIKIINILENKISNWLKN
jgi:hypothetical protein